MIDRRQEGGATVKGLSDWQKGQVGGSRFRRRKEWVRRVCPIWRRKRSVSWYRVREVDRSGDRARALGLIGMSLEEVNDH